MPSSTTCAVSVERSTFGEGLSISLESSDFKPRSLVSSSSPSDCSSLFNDHEYTVNPSDDGPGPLCDRCDADVRQTAKHIFQECDAFAHLRLLVFKDTYPWDFSEITDAQLTRFIDEINIQWFPFEDPDAMADL